MQHPTWNLLLYVMIENLEVRPPGGYPLSSVSVKIVPKTILYRMGIGLARLIQRIYSTLEESKFIDQTKYLQIQMIMFFFYQLVALILSLFFSFTVESSRKKKKRQMIIMISIMNKACSDEVFTRSTQETIDQFSTSRVER